MSIVKDYYLKNYTFLSAEYIIHHREENSEHEWSSNLDAIDKDGTVVCLCLFSIVNDEYLLDWNTYKMAMEELGFAVPNKSNLVIDFYKKMPTPVTYYKFKQSLRPGIRIETLKNEELVNEYTKFLCADDAYSGFYDSTYNLTPAGVKFGKTLKTELLRRMN